MSFKEVAILLEKEIVIEFIFWIWVKVRLYVWWKNLIEMKKVNKEMDANNLKKK